jgi:hypothetical protein
MAHNEREMSLNDSNTSLKESSKSINESDEWLMESNAALLTERHESLISDVDAALKRLKTAEFLKEQRSSLLAQSSKRLEEALKRVESVELSLNAEEALHIVKTLALRELFTTSRKAHQPEGVPEKTTFQEHIDYSKHGGGYTGDVTPRKVLEALDKVTLHVTLKGNQVAHADRPYTKES